MANDQRRPRHTSPREDRDPKSPGASIAVRDRDETIRDDSDANKREFRRQIGRR
jgi:hypothetical protein